ncbi:MAG TPA: hypothetical protein VFU01_12515 [Gemmatimonadaceae bacterium]|nr:hypothetical protein [Gemmatimonadaceae bacterium]
MSSFVLLSRGSIDVHRIDWAARAPCTGPAARAILRLALRELSGDLGIGRALSL